MTATNYDDVVQQLRAAGFSGRGIDDRVVVGKLVRCALTDDREKRGWYILHEFAKSDGSLLLVGSFGINRGNDHGTQKIEIRKTEWTPEQRAALRARLAADRKRVEAERKAEQTRAARHASAAWGKCLTTGESEYLTRKQVLAHGVKFGKSGTLVVPMMDAAGIVHGLQLIRTAKQAETQHRPQKEFWPRGLAKKGHFHLIGIPASIVLVAEGYATAASLHEATTYPVAVAFDAGNLLPVAQALHKRYPRAKVLVCADDDAFAKCGACGERLELAQHPTDCPKCHAQHHRVNTGCDCASAAALAVNGSWLRPVFADQAKRAAQFLERGIKITDFNDLAVAEGSTAVRMQVEAHLAAIVWRLDGCAAPISQPWGRGDALAPIESLDDLLRRYAMVYGQGGVVFDRDEHVLLTISDMRDACVTRQLHRAWAEHPGRAIVRIAEVGFDPSGADETITCNLWAGWPTQPAAGKCAFLLGLLEYMCSNDEHSQRLYDWVLRWIAYPIQHPGAKMKTALVIHGPQGTGKNLLFEAVMAIYGPYGRVIGQDALEDKFNDWASRKLFLIADEVVARSDLYHVKNKLKAFITGDWIRINPKQIKAYDERNHVNLVFLSNESLPVVLDPDDRRHAVIWTPDKAPPDYYQSVLAEIRAGGIAALHDYLLNLDLGDFGPASQPPTTQAKAELISLGMDSPSRWLRDLVQGDIGSVPAVPCLSEDAYSCYRLWCARTGDGKPRSQPQFINHLARREKVHNARKRYLIGADTRGPHGVMYLGTEEMPPGMDESDWLGGNIVKFKTALSQLRQGVYGE